MQTSHVQGFNPCGSIRAVRPKEREKGGAEGGAVGGERGRGGGGGAERDRKRGTGGGGGGGDRLQEIACQYKTIATRTPLPSSRPPI
jgi:hypothetical protein